MVKAESVFIKFTKLFQCLPLAALVVTYNGNYFACSGGISAKMKTLDDIRTLFRYREPEDEFAGKLSDLLWSEPHPEEC